MARHRAVTGRSRWRRSSAPAPVPAQRLPGIEMVDALTKLTHRVSSDELLAGRQSGDYLGLCGTRFPAGSMVEPGRGQCPGCTS
jgi:hypothetical protein